MKQWNVNWEIRQVRQKLLIVQADPQMYISKDSGAFIVRTHEPGTCGNSLLKYQHTFLGSFLTNLGPELSSQHCQSAQLCEDFPCRQIIKLLCSLFHLHNLIIGLYMIEHNHYCLAKTTLAETLHRTKPKKKPHLTAKSSDYLQTHHLSCLPREHSRPKQGIVLKEEEIYPEMATQRWPKKDCPVR